jgi:hypothetical protein
MVKLQIGVKIPEFPAVAPRTHDTRFPSRHSGDGVGRTSHEDAG